MFVSMGLSAIFPVLHGLHLYGLSQMRKQIGLSWLSLQGVLYVLGAGIYAVKLFSCSADKSSKSDEVNRLACLRSGFLVDTTFGAAHIRSSTFW